uniref:Uncharacterized protein n=1 Tax=Arundo donax TaxID=35708 RepID=A0A0A9G9I7_ARUDO
MPKRSHPLRGLCQRLQPHSWADNVAHIHHRPVPVVSSSLSLTTHKGVD